MWNGEWDVAEGYTRSHTFLSSCVRVRMYSKYTYILNLAWHTYRHVDSLQRKLRLSHVYKWMIPICFCESREWENSEAGINGAYTCCVYIYIYILYKKFSRQRERLIYYKYCELFQTVATSDYVCEVAFKWACGARCRASWSL